MLESYNATMLSGNHPSDANATFIDVCGVVSALEKSGQFAQMLHIDTFTIIINHDTGCFRFSLYGHISLASIFQRIVDQVGNRPLQ